MKCPLTGKKCLEKDCKWWIHLLGENPQTGSMVDRFDCVISWIPLLLVEIAKESKSGGIATESFRNETVKVLKGGFMAMLEQNKHKQIEDKNE
jgi:hypothetical protein